MYLRIESRRYTQPLVLAYIVLALALARGNAGSFVTAAVWQDGTKVATNLNRAQPLLAAAQPHYCQAVFRWFFVGSLAQVLLALARLHLITARHLITRRHPYAYVRVRIYLH